MAKVLFVIQRLGIGGSVTSLLNFLELLNQAGLKADLFVMEHEGVFFERAAECANILPENRKLAAVICEPEKLRKYGMRGLIHRCVYSLQYKFRDVSKVRNQLFEEAANCIGEYDIAVAYSEGTATVFTQYIRSKKKIAWVHTIYERFVKNVQSSEMQKLYSRFEKIVCVAPAAAEAFKKGLPALNNKVCMIPNPLNAERIKEQSKVSLSFGLNEESNIIISVGRLSPEKQYDLAILAAQKLNESGVPFKWYIIGDGSERKRLEDLIQATGLFDRVILVGMMGNPYPLIVRADVLVISSLYEAQPMVANEAFILDVPVITTNYPSASTLVEHNVNGIICDMSVEGLYLAIKQFLTDVKYQNQLKKGARDFKYNSTEIVDTFLGMIDV